MRWSATLTGVANARSGYWSTGERRSDPGDSGTDGPVRGRADRGGMGHPGSHGRAALVNELADTESRVIGLRFGDLTAQRVQCLAQQSRHMHLRVSQALRDLRLGHVL